MATGATVLVDGLARLGVDRLFTLSGNQILAVYDACLDHGISVTDTRHEAAAGHMAEAWARLHDTPAVCLVSAGPGHTNTVSAMANAYRNEAPVLWVSGGSDTRVDGRGGFQELDQPSVAGPVCKVARRVERAADVASALAWAWRAMLAGRPGPVHLTLPADVLAATTASALLDPTTCLPTPNLATPASVTAAISALAAAHRPLLIAGPSAGRGLARQLLTGLAERLDAPWFVLDSPRGLTDPALHGIGRATQLSDCLLMVGPVDYALAFAGPRALAADAVLIHVDAGGGEPLGSHPKTISLVGDAVSVLRQLEAPAMPAPSRAGWRDQVDTLRRAAELDLTAAAAADTEPLHPLRVATDVRAVLPPGAAVAIDGGEFAQWARWAFGGADVVGLVNGKYGMLGPAIPYAIAARLARPDHPAVAFVGDGTAGYHLLELDTALRHAAPVVVIVGNDAGWAAERHRQVSLFGADRLVAADLLPTRYDEVARALGGHGEFVERAVDLRPAIVRALACGRPACVNVRIASVPSPANPV